MTFEGQLKISDGTTTISLINIGPGIHLNDWTPAITQYKGGGVFRSNPQATGRRLVQKVFDNAIETFDLKIDNIKRNVLIVQMQEVLRLLEKATDYWTTDWQNVIVYLIAQAECEDNPRYAGIVSYSIPQLDNPYAQPFLNVDGNAVFDGITLGIERKHWAESIPGTDISIETSNSESYDGRSLGRAATTTDEVYAASRSNVANITDIYVDDGTVFGSNLMDAVLPYSLLPAVPALNDAVYFGIDTSLADSGPFSSLVFDIGTASVHTGELRWEYWSGAAWSVLITQDWTDALENTDVNSVHWPIPSDWVTTTVNGVTGYWVRLNFFTAGAVTTATQQNRDVYSIIWSYVEIDIDQVGGDIPALSRISISQRGKNQTTFAGTDQLAEGRVITGLRSTNRGINFTPFLNCADEQNPGIDSATAVSNTTFATDVLASTGRRATYNPGGVEPLNPRIQFDITTNQAHWFGTFHVFIRARQVGGNVGDINVALQIVSGVSSSRGVVMAQTNTEIVHVLDEWELVDLGRIAFPPVGTLNSSTELFGFFGIYVLADCTSGSPPDLYLNDVVLVPVDEWSADVFTIEVFSRDVSVFIDPPRTLHLNGRIDIDSITYPKADITAVVRNLSEDDDDIVLVPSLVNNGTAILQANTTQRLYFLATKRSIITGTHTGANNQATLTDAAADFINAGVAIGQMIINGTDTSFATITAVTATTITGTLTGGVGDDWDTNDTYYILTDKWVSRPGMAHSLQLYRNVQYLGMRGDR